MNGAIAAAAQAPPQPQAPAAPAPPWLGIVALLFGAIASSLTSRLTSSGLADIRGAIGAGVDEGAWITTAFTTAQMLIGPASVWFGRTLGMRRILLVGCALYGMAELLIPFAAHLPWVIALQAIAGIGSGTFIPLTLAFIFVGLPRRLWPYGIAAYILNIVLGLNIAAALEGWYSEYASWHWIFWQNAVIAVPLFWLLWHGMPRAKPDYELLRRGDHSGIALASIGLALVFAALDQGDRLDWTNSGLIVGMALAGVALVALFLVHQAALEESPLDFSVLLVRDVVFALSLIAVVRFLVTSSNILVPGFLTQVRGLRTLEAGQTLLWVGLPQLVIAPAVAWLLTRIDPRIALFAGMSIVAVACLLAAQLDSSWAEADFALPLLIQAVGQTMAVTALIYYAAHYITPLNALSIGAIIQTSRLFGGEVGTATLNGVVRKSEQIHSQFLGLHVVAGDPTVLDRLAGYAAAVDAASQGAGLASDRAVALLANAVRAQAYTMAYADGFRLSILVALFGAFVALILRKAPEMQA
ncbi:MAG: MFS transporter [Dokdonella sp.]